ncbi:MAG: hypothetical protein P1U67_01275 [Alcanivoracaceae bacterium]|nr:hypothetical protein [Alcanivoracaceae bacterium]
MKRIGLIAGLPLAVLASNVVAAETRTSAVRDNGFSYTYVQGGYESQDWDGGVDVNALDGKLSYALDEHLFVRAGLQFLDGDYNRGRGDFDGWAMSGGLGFHTPLQQRLDLVVTGDIIHIDYDFDDDTGFAIAGGVRHATTDKVELAGGAFLQDVRDSEFGVYGNALYHATPAVDVGAELRLGDDATVFGLFGRYNF